MPIDPAALAELQLLYADLERRLVALNPRCEACGKCCHFDEMEHELFASELELALLLATPPPPQAVPPGRCPYQMAEACTAHARRLLGCRLHFCRPGRLAPELEALSGEFHARLKRLHDELGLPWRYGRALPELAAGS